MILKKVKFCCSFSFFAIFLSLEGYAQEKTFTEVVEHLKTEVKDIIVLEKNNGLVALSPSYQGRIFTSSTNGWQGKSRGWINWEYIDEGTSSKNMAYLGGESRLWFAPEFGKFSVFHKPGTPLTPKTMVAPTDLDSKPFQLIEKDSVAVTVSGVLEIKNYQDETFNIEVHRNLRIFSKEDIEHNLDITLHETIDVVGFSAYTSVTNIDEDWNEDNGLISIWELGCNLTTADNTLIIPLSKEQGIVTPYFGDLTSNRLQIKDDVVYFKVDAAYLNKIGIPPSHTKNVMGSYSPSMHLLNIVTFNYDEGERYMSSDPKNLTDPYKGDVINVFNGEVDLAEDHNWPFFEFESSSEAKPLKHDESLTHYQTTYHFEGDFKSLNKISKKILGVDLKNIPAF